MEFFTNFEGIKLYRQIYQPINPPIKAFVFICHGLFEHCESNYYETIIKPFTHINCLVLTHDHYGHGRSEGLRGIISDVEMLSRDVISDIEETIKDLHLSEALPKYLYGHSMGGLISVQAVLKNKGFFSGMILEAPALSSNVNRALTAFACLLNYIHPNFPLKQPDYDKICRNKDIVEGTKKDKLCIHSPLKAVTAVSLLKSLNQDFNRFKDIDVPVIIGHGDADLLTELKGSAAFIETISSTDKRLIIYPGAKHQLRSETENVDIEFTSIIVDWLKERIKRIEEEQIVNNL